MAWFAAHAIMYFKLAGGITKTVWEFQDLLAA